MGTIGLLGPISQIHALDESSSSVVLLVGLAVGVDYAMFYLRREMEERDARPHPGRRARTPPRRPRAARCSISGLTVMAAMAGMFLAGNAVFVSFGIGTILVVAVAMLGSVTVLPAMLSFLSRKGWTEKGRVPVGRQAAPPDAAASRASGARSSTACSSARCVSVDPGRRPARRAHHPGVLDAHPQPGRHRPAARPRGHADLRPIHAAFPGDGVPAVTVVKAADVTAPEVQARDRRPASARRSPPAS